LVEEACVEEEVSRARALAGKDVVVDEAVATRDPAHGRTRRVVAVAV